jgi:DNA-binding transcriptional MocR family regulator
MSERTRAGSAAGAAIDWTPLLAGRAARLRASEIRELLKLLDRPDVISFAGGIPDPAVFPREAMLQAHATLLGDPARAAQALQYAVSEGYLPLRRWIAERMTSQGVPCDTGNVLITSGSQQALDFLARLFLSPGATALVAAPTYLGALQAFNASEPRYDALSFENPTRTAPALRAAAAAAGSRAALAYVVPDFGNPTGETLTLESRKNLLDLITDLGVPLVEDLAYEALRYDGTPLPSCLALDIARHGHIDRSLVVGCGTFSKTIAPGLRIGWIVAARDVIDKLVLVKQGADLHSTSLSQMVMVEVVSAVYEAQVKRVVSLYAPRRDAMVNALRRHMPAGVRWTTPQGGMFVWVTLPAGFDGAVLLEAALAEERVAFVPGAAFFADGSGRNTIRLNFTRQSEAVIDEGVSRLGGLVARQLAGIRPGHMTRASIA